MLDNFIGQTLAINTGLIRFCAKAVWGNFIAERIF
jgi:hypothetical protein